MTMQDVGFIGLGDQGGPMADRIHAAGMPLTVWARRPEVLEPYVAKGATAAASIAELGVRCGHVGVCVVADADVLAVCDELISAMARGSRIAVHATVLPETVIEVARRAETHGIDVIDAPVSGMRAGAEAGTLAVMCGGSRQAFAAARPVFETFGKTIVLLGAVGCGQQAKVIINAMAAANLGVAHTALGLADTLDLDRAAFVELASQSGGRSFAFDVRARLASPDDFAHNAALLVKDLKILSTIAPDDRAVQIFMNAADDFLRAATAQQ